MGFDSFNLANYLWVYIVSIILAFFIGSVSFHLDLTPSIRSNTFYFCASIVLFSCARIEFYLLFFFCFVLVSVLIPKVNYTHYWMMMNISIDKSELMHNRACSISWTWFLSCFFFWSHFNFILICIRFCCVCILWFQIGWETKSFIFVLLKGRSLMNLDTPTNIALRFSVWRGFLLKSKPYSFL